MTIDIHGFRSWLDSERAPSQFVIEAYRRDPVLSYLCVVTGQNWVAYGPDISVAGESSISVPAWIGDYLTALHLLYGSRTINKIYALQMLDQVITNLESKEQEDR